MSHASIIVALSAKDLARHGDVKSAVAHQMKPFDENGHWGAKGSRWDWWQIGGRYSGKFNPAPDVVQVKELDYDAMRRAHVKRLAEDHAKALFYSPQMGELVYGVRVMSNGDFESLDDFIGRHQNDAGFPAAYAFLQDRQWHEQGRLGMFGMELKTECEIANPDLPDNDDRRCVFRKRGAVIYSWKESRWRGRSGLWHARYHDRFIKPLDGDTTLVLVDYHV